MKIGGTMTKIVGCLEHCKATYMIELASLIGVSKNVVVGKMIGLKAVDLKR
jgi:hypothetical protein